MHGYCSPTHPLVWHSFGHFSSFDFVKPSLEESTSYTKEIFVYILYK